VFETTPGAIRVRLHRARKALKDKLAEGDEDQLTRVRDLS
jgi:hypothetical protein